MYIAPTFLLTMCQVKIMIPEEITEGLFLHNGFTATWNAYYHITNFNPFLIMNNGTKTVYCSFLSRSS